MILMELSIVQTLAVFSDISQYILDFHIVDSDNVVYTVISWFTHTRFIPRNIAIFFGIFLFLWYSM